MPSVDDDAIPSNSGDNPWGYVLTAASPTITTAQKEFLQELIGKKEAYLLGQLKAYQDASKVLGDLRKAAPEGPAFDAYAESISQLGRLTDAVSAKLDRLRAFGAWVDSLQVNDNPTADPVLT